MVSSSAILFLLVHTVQCAVLASMQYSMSIKRKLHSYKRTIIDDDLKSF